MKPDKQTVLIVDDEAINIQVLAAALQFSYEVTAVTSGVAALEAVRGAARPDIILLDVMMPEMSGYDVCRILKEDENTKNIPIIFVTARHEPEHEEYGLNLGAVDYISKPFALATVLARVRNHLALKLKSDTLESLVSLDGLTGIPNRRRFDGEFDVEWRRAKRGGHPVSLVMLDIDYFKRYNDSYGHGAGDGCLIRVATCLVSCLNRAGDLLARYGGEEFVALLPFTDAQGAAGMAERFVAEVSSLAIPHLFSEVSGYVTISAGCATVVPAKGASKLNLLKTADGNLYLAKHLGRNRVCT